MEFPNAIFPQEKKKPTKTHCAFIADRSGSMESVRDLMISGANDLIGGMKADKDTDTRVTYTQFDNEYEIVYTNRPAPEVPYLTRETYVPRGSTALYDAIGKTLNQIDVDLAGKKEAVLVIIMTDGQNNSSKEFTLPMVRKMIDERTARGNFTFVFLGEKTSAWSDAKNLGIPQGNVQGYSPAETKKTLVNTSLSRGRWNSGVKLGHYTSTTDFFGNQENKPPIELVDTVSSTNENP